MLASAGCWVVPTTRDLLADRKFRQTSLCQVDLLDQILALPYQPLPMEVYIVSAIKKGANRQTGNRLRNRGTGLRLGVQATESS
jgi:hypothetical protein